MKFKAIVNFRHLCFSQANCGFLNITVQFDLNGTGIQFYGEAQIEKHKLLDGCQFPSYCVLGSGLFTLIIPCVSYARPAGTIETAAVLKMSVLCEGLLYQELAVSRHHTPPQNMGPEQQE